jgi:hypothetical protein
MKSAVSAGKSFYIHLWHDAPHKPIEAIPSFLKPSMVGGKGYTDSIMYKSMIQSVDAGIGQIQKALINMGIENNTILVFCLIMDRKWVWVALQDLEDENEVYSKEVYESHVFGN